jgi:hypothetical protein
LGLSALLGPPWRERDLAYALIVSRVVRPKPKLSPLAWWGDVSLGADLGVTGASRNEVYAAMDWLLKRRWWGLPAPGRRGARLPGGLRPRRVRRIAT